MWKLKQTAEFQSWFDNLSIKFQDKIIEQLEVLRQLGPHFGRPKTDTMKESSIKNLKELRLSYREKVIRIFYVFDHRRDCILLTAADKRGQNSKRFYRRMITLCEAIYLNYIEEDRSDQNE